MENMTQTDRKPTVLVTDQMIRKEAIAVLEKDCDVRVIQQYSPEAVVVGAVRDVEAILARNAKITKNVLAAAPRLKIVARHGVGVDSVDLAEATRCGILVTITPEANAVTVSEYVFALLLAFARKIMEGHASVMAGRWDKPRLVGCELYQKTMGIIGLGNIGSRVAQRARGFGMDVVGHDPYLTPARAAALHVRLATLDALLAEADIVTLHVRATPETRALIGERQLERMKPGAILVNTSRGEVVNEGALINALQQKRIAGACLDTFREEPLQAGSPLRDLDNVILTPHVAGQSVEAMTRMGVEAAGYIVQALKGEIPGGIYNREVLESAEWSRRWKES
jgi:D-3-phosphoglycerate dehydrogenase